MAHIHELNDFISTVFIVFQNKVLLRLHEKYNIWTGAGGHIELDEDPNQAAIREVKEEVGLDIELVSDNFHTFPAYNHKYTDLIPPFAMNIHQIKDGPHHHIDLIFAAITESDKIILESPTDVVKWLSRQEIESADYLDLRRKQYALKALEIASKLQQK